MKIRHADLHDLAAARTGSRAAWFEVARACLEKLPVYPSSRILVAEEDGCIRAVLGLQLFWGASGRVAKATIRVLRVDPEHNHRGIGSRLVRFAEGIARVHGCARVDVAPGLERWGGGGCWLGLGYDDPGAGLHKVLRPAGDWRSA